MMGVILGVVTAAFFVVNTGDLLTAFAVAVGIAALPRFVAVKKRIIGYNYRCDQCGHRWTSAPSLAVPRLSHD